MTYDFNDSFFNIVRLGIGNDANPYQKSLDWNDIQELASRQGLEAIVLDGIDKLSESARPPKEILLEWIGEVLNNYENRYLLYGKAIAEMAGLYNRNGFKMMVLKGYACSLDWPKPEHRPCGDIDIWQFGEYKKADALISSEKGIKIDNSHHHHTVFYWRDFMVENHYDFINVYAHKSNSFLEKNLKELGRDDSHYIELYGERVYLPSPNLHALFLIKHAASHFASSNINLRQVLDWAFFVKNHTNEIDWGWFNRALEQFHMRDFFNIINAICVDDLGFDSRIFQIVQFNPLTKDRVLKDILYPKYGAEAPHDLIQSLLFKFKRWQGNSWKHQLCYDESRWSAFWYGVWSHMIKPSEG